MGVGAGRRPVSGLGPRAFRAELKTRQGLARGPGLPAAGGGGGGGGVPDASNFMGLPSCVPIRC